MLLSLSILLSLPLLAVATVPSIGNVPAYTSQRACAQSCFGDNVNGAAWVIAEHVDCTYDDPRAISNECICRIDIQPSADAWLSQCVNTQCSQNTVDIISAVSIYNAYCTDAGFGSTSSGAQATTTQPGTNYFPTATVTVTAVRTVFVTSAARRLATPFYFRFLGQFQ